MSEPSPLGHLAVANAERDAVHVAIIPVRALEKLMPGDHVGFVEANGVSRQALEKVGIIDPFLSRAVRANQWCYLLLYPNTVTGMRHHWQHPAFPAGPVTNAPGHVREQEVGRYLDGYEVDDTAVDETGERCRAIKRAPVDVPRLNGFCIAGRVASFFRVGNQPFSPSIPMAGNEDDFFRRSEGSRRVVPQSFVFHYRSVSRGLDRPGLDGGAKRLAGCVGCGK